MIFRRFGGLAARNLLYLQNELAYLEYKLKILEQIDSTSTVGEKDKYAVNPCFLMNSNRTMADGTLRDGDMDHCEVMVQIQETLSKYSKYTQEGLRCVLSLICA